ncbi:5-oxoprolinase subunit B family protein [Amycolatopsis taiwanensis]|uniref:5-oxoprolinase subunit B family protein n=1 Tax=Amycolatopsis taiwanensis TaxID=342230 RepID=UPI0004ADBB0E|nr:allophanate hydrolase subunit 1 [Amycolatopsis taiwanensis]
MTEPASGAITSVRRVGDRGLLIELAERVDAHRVAAFVRDHPCAPELTEVIPAARTVFLLGRPSALDRIGRAIPTAAWPEVDERRGKTVVVPVRYDGPDLHEVAERTGLSVREVVRRHSGTEYRVAFFGFAPGQAFFSALPDVLRVPRRPSPRVRVPSGSVAIANEFTVIYPLDSPGGWNLIGTRAGPPLWNTQAQPPNAVDVGDRVVFDEVR